MHDEVAHDVRARRRQLRTDVHEDERPGEPRPRQGGVHRVPASHGVAEHDRTLDALIGEEGKEVIDHGAHRIVELAAPLTVTMAPLVQRVHVVPVGEMQADEIPRVQ